ncbi:MAG: hypothetical protein AB7S72_02270 [Draconibacterium sp.]|jgi:hypothetical protein
MKKTFYIALLASGLMFNACNPMQEINDELESIYAQDDEKAVFLKDKKIAPAAYTLTDADYALSSNESVKNYKNFSASVLPKDYLPEILNKKFSAENAQSMMVTYNFYAAPVVDYAGARITAEDEYLQMGQKYANFSDDAIAQNLIAKLFDREVFASEAGTEKTAQYVKYQTNMVRYVKVNADFTTEVLTSASDAVVVTDAQYEAVGKGKYKNFDDIAQAQTLLAELAQTEATAPITYSCKVYKNYIDKYVVYLYTGTNWVIKKSVMPVSEELNYSLDATDITKSTWWADPAIKITLGASDYALYPETSKYSNFDVRGSIAPGTDRAKLAEMIGGMLDANHNAVENQQYLVKYAYYDGSNGVTTIRVIKEAGAWKEYTN